MTYFRTKSRFDLLYRFKIKKSELASTILGAGGQNSESSIQFVLLVRGKLVELGVQHERLIAM